jgi:hypothetical protein
VRKTKKKSEVKERNARESLMVIVGRTKIPYSDLFVLNRSEIEALIEGHDMDKRDDWERQRKATFIEVSPNFKKGSRITVDKLWPLPWDNEGKKQTPIEDNRALVEMAKKVYGNLKKKKDG